MTQGVLFVSSIVTSISIAFVANIVGPRRIFSSLTRREIWSMFPDVNYYSSSQIFWPGSFKHWASASYSFQHLKNDVWSDRFFHLPSSISKYFWHELQQRVSGMPNSNQLLIFLIEYKPLLKASLLSMVH
jgi:hypothetical protein